MSNFDFSVALPNGKRSFFLKKQVVESLQQSLTYIFESLEPLLSETLAQKCAAIIDDISSLDPRHSSIFSYVFLNSLLIQAIQNQDEKRVLKLLESFSYRKGPEPLQTKIIPYGSKVLPATFWPLVDEEIKFHLPVETYIQLPSQEALSRMSTLFEQAIRIIKASSNEHYEELRTLMSDVLILNSNEVKAGSGFNILGMMYCRDDVELGMVTEYMVHELAHQYLFFLNTFDELCSGEGLHEAPMRKDKRPIEGIYHASFVLARLIMFYKQCMAVDTPFSNDFLKEKIADYQTKFLKGYNKVLEVATLTDLGRGILENSYGLSFGKN